LFTKVAAFLLVGAAAVCLALPAAGAQQAPPNGCTINPKITDCPWKKKVWYDAVNSKFTLVSTTVLNSGQKDCSWGAAVGVINSNTNDFPLGGCGRPFYVWSKTCTAAAQTVDFKKTVFLPGVPAVLQASLSAYKRPLKAMEVLVNGHVIVSATHAVHKVDLKSRASAFKFGNNVIEISARKAASKKPCNGSETDTGFLVELHAEFHADYEVTIDPPNNTSSSLFIQFVTVKNNGPSASAYGSVAYAVSTGNLQPLWKNGAGVDPNAGVVIYAGEAVLSNCKYFSSGGYSTYCVIGGLQPGQSERFTVKYLYKDPGGNFSDKWTESWGAASDTLDPNQANNGGKRPRGACRPPGNPPPCG
jgi:hypothetical protein